MLPQSLMGLLVRTASLFLGATALGLAANAARPDGVPLFAWQPSTVCEVVADVAELTPVDAQQICADPDTLVIDVRTHEQFAHGHLPMALHLPCQKERLEDRTFEQLSTASSILVYGQTTEEARTVAHSLAQRNLPVRVLAGGYPSWEAAGLACSSGPCEGCLGTLHEH